MRREFAGAVPATVAGSRDLLPVNSIATTRDQLEYGVLRLALGLLGGLPRKLALRIGAGIGSAFYWLDARDRRIALANLDRAFPAMPEAQRREVLRRSCRNLGRMLAEVCHFEALTPENIDRYVVVEQPALWENAVHRADTGGAIILTAHFGNFELLAYHQGLRGHPVTLAHRTMRNPLVDRLILDMRARVGTVSLPKKQAARQLLRALRERRMIALLADQNQTRNAGVFADLFGTPACTTPGPARLAIHTGAPIIPAFLVRDGESERHRLVIYPDVEPVDSGDRDADIVATTALCNRAIERALSDYPDQWIWFHRRWKTRPPGEPPLY